jgi:hypothetical protein
MPDLAIFRIGALRFKSLVCWNIAVPEPTTTFGRPALVKDAVIDGHGVRE